LLSAFDKNPQHIVHEHLVAATGLPEPRQHVGIDADMDGLFARRQIRYGPAPIRGLVQVAQIGSDASLDLGLRHTVDLGTIGCDFHYAGTSHPSSSAE